MKKIIFTTVLLVQTVLLFAQAQIQTNVYKWGSGKTAMFDGAGAIFSKQVLKGHAIAGGKKLKFNTGASGDELFFIIKYGPVHVELNGVPHDLDKGSVVFVLPGDDVVFHNKRKDDVEIYEMQMALMNRSLSGDLETIFIPTSQAYGHVSSTLVKEVATYGGDVSSLVPPLVARKIAEKTRKG